MVNAWSLRQRSSSCWELAYGAVLAEWKQNLPERQELCLDLGSALTSCVISNKPLFWIRPPFPQLQNNGVRSLKPSVLLVMFCDSKIS